MQIMIVILREVGRQVFGHPREARISIMEAFRSRLFIHRRDLDFSTVGKVGLRRKNHNAIFDCAFIAHG